MKFYCKDSKHSLTYFNNPFSFYPWNQPDHINTSFDVSSSMDKEKDGSKCTNSKCKCPNCTCGSKCTCMISMEVVCDPCKDFKSEMEKKKQETTKTSK